MAVVQPHGGTQLTAAATAGPATLVLRKIKWCLRDKWRISVQCFFTMAIVFVLLEIKDTFSHRNKYVSKSSEYTFILYDMKTASFSRIPVFKFQPIHIT